MGRSRTLSMRRKQEGKGGKIMIIGPCKFPTKVPPNVPPKSHQSPAKVPPKAHQEPFSLRDSPALWSELCSKSTETGRQNVGRENVPVTALPTNWPRRPRKETAALRS